jgi:hypothetical protein
VRLVLKMVFSAFLVISVPVALLRLFTDFGLESLTLAIFSPLLAWWIIGGMWGFDPPGPGAEPATSAEQSDR